MIKIGLNNNISKLSAYGGCIQDGTPTPSAPVNIMCNNGTLQMVDDELPSGYKRLLGIHFNGDFHYRTVEALTGDDDVTMTLDNTSSSGKNVFGSYNGSNSKNFSLYLYGGGSTSGTYFRYGDQLKRPVFGDGKQTITFGRSGTQGFKTDVDVTPDEFTTPENTYIGMLPNSSSPSYVGDIVGSILVSNRLEWIPCENPGGVIGYYEKYNGNFIAPTGSGTPISLGYDDSHMILSVVGTPEVITVSDGASTQTVSVENLLAVGDYKDEQEIISGVVARKCGIKVLDGTEEWTTDTYGGSRRMVMQDIINASGNTLPVVCSHYMFRPSDERQQANSIFIAGTGKIVIYIDSTQSITTVAEFNAWLASQYVAGTPVIMVYPLVEETTEQVTLQPVQGTAAVITQASIDNLEVKTKAYNDLLKRYITDASGTLQEVLKVYIGNNLIWTK